MRFVITLTDEEFATLTDRGKYLIETLMMPPGVPDIDLLIQREGDGDDDALAQAELAEWFCRNTDKWPKDWACNRCAPGSEMSRSGFVCTPHRAVDWMCWHAQTEDRQRGNNDATK